MMSTTNIHQHPEDLVHPGTGPLPSWVSAYRILLRPRRWRPSFRSSLPSGGRRTFSVDWLMDLMVDSYGGCFFMTWEWHGNFPHSLFMIGLVKYIPYIYSISLYPYIQGDVFLIPKFPPTSTSWHRHEDPVMIPHSQRGLWLPAPHWSVGWPRWWPHWSRPKKTRTDWSDAQVLRGLHMFHNLLQCRI